MKSIKNLTRMTYETAAFQGWRLALSSKGTAFIRYFPDKKYGGEEQSFAAEAALAALKGLLDGARLADGKHTAATRAKVGKLLERA